MNQSKKENDISKTPEPMRRISMSNKNNIASKTLEYPQSYVYMIESPSPQDLMDNMQEGKLIREALNLIGIECVYQLATDRECFEIAIKDALRSRLRQSEDDPIIHISAHGVIKKIEHWTDCTGIALTDGTEITWEELEEYLTEINQMMHVPHLILCMSSCYGYAGFTMALTHNKKLPYMALIGNTKKYDWYESAIAFATFYFQYFNKGATLGKAIRAMKTASGNNNFDLVSGEEVRDFWLNSKNKRKAKS
jgi:hypothetical protein